MWLCGDFEECGFLPWSRLAVREPGTPSPVCASAAPCHAQCRGPSPLRLNWFLSVLLFLMLSYMDHFLSFLPPPHRIIHC